MSKPRVLSVGQCGFDHASISQVLTRSFGAEVKAAGTHAEAVDALANEHFDLVLVNRIGDEDGAPGVELIRTLKADPETANVSLMLVSNIATAQSEAQSLGALEGFGKSDLSKGKEIGALRQVFATIGK